MNVLKPQQKQAVLALLERGVSQHEIARKLGVDRKTIRKLAQAPAAPEAPANSPMATGPHPQNPPPRPPASGDGPTVAPAVSCVRSACEDHRAWIEAQVRLGRNAMAIYQDLVDRFGFSHRYNSVKRFCRHLKPKAPEAFDRLEFGPAEEAQVDYGEGALTRDPVSGRYRRPRLFVMTLKYSRRSFRRVVWKSSTEAWARLHEEAWRSFGGSCRYVVLDNLREGVITPDLYEPELNRLYAAMLAHYGVVADPARVRDPNRKGTVENAIQHTQSTALKGRRFESLDDQNAFLTHWEETWAAQRIHGRTKRRVQEMFEEERPYLQPLPLTAFRYFSEGTRTVQDDTTVQVAGAWYAARPAPIGARVLVRVYAHEIEIRDAKTLALIRRHPRAARQGTVQLPDAERLFNPSRETHRILAQAHAIGPHTHALCQELFERRGRVGQRALWGIIGLRRRYPAPILEQACATALERGTATYKAVQAIAEQRLAAVCQAMEAQAQSDGAPTLTQHHELIRETAAYAAFFKRHARSDA